MPARTPAPWSYSALEDFKNCPFAYYNKRVIKAVKDEGSEHTEWGTRVHKHFEDRQLHGTPLPMEVSEHENMMQRLDAIPGDLYAERKVALTRDRQPCDFNDPNVWWRGIIDWTKVHEKSRKAVIRDYKTGKMHSKFGQLKLFAIYTFIEFPRIDEVDCKFIWTKFGMVTGEVYHREEVPKLWAEFIPDLKQYVEAFKTDTWQCRPSGLCNGWCPVTTCEHWKPKRRKY